MATLVKLRGLDRGDSAVGSSNVARGFRVKSAFKNYTGTGAVAATVALGSGNSQVNVTSKYGGSAFNGISVALVDPPGNNVALSVATALGTDGLPDITVTLATDGASAITSTAAQVAAAINANAEASQWVTAAAGGTGAGVVVAAAATPLATGAQTGSSTSNDIYVRASSKVTAVVDIDDDATMKSLRRNAGRFLSLGAV